MISSSPRRFLGVRFNYYDEADEKLLDESLHRQLSILQPSIKAFCESLYNWEILDTDERLDPETRLFTSIRIPLEGMASQFRRKNNPELFRYFHLEVSVIDEDKVSLMLFENMTENSNYSPFRYQEVASADVDAAILGIKARDHYRPSTEEGGKSGT
jgi:hypothetical protein